MCTRLGVINRYENVTLYYVHIEKHFGTTFNVGYGWGGGRLTGIVREFIYILYMYLLSETGTETETETETETKTVCVCQYFSKKT